MNNLDPFDPSRWQTTAPFAVIERNGIGPPATSRRIQGKFLRGPISWDWLLSAMKLPGKAVHVGLMLWLEVGLQKSMTIHFCLSRAVRQGIPINTARRAVHALERAGLIVVKRLPGRGLDVTLLTQQPGTTPTNSETQR